jgi:hypothetical protein
MDSVTRNNKLNDIISAKFSPTQDERTYVSQKYQALQGVIGGNVFQSGSYGRFTAIHPVHDLDVIYVCTDPLLESQPLQFMQGLKRIIDQSGIAGVTTVSVQTHSITVCFGDTNAPFSIDVVPALELYERNEFSQPLYRVPEILLMNKRHREKRYMNAASDPIKWVKSDPRGYLQAASDLNATNDNFRHTVKLAKAWRHAAKATHGDAFKLKSFHIELIVTDYFLKNLDALTADALIGSLGNIGSSLRVPSIPDRADPLVFVDQYVADLSQQEKTLIYELQANAHAASELILSARDDNDLQKAVSGLVDIKKTTPVTSPATPIAPHRPWAW